MTRDENGLSFVGFLRRTDCEDVGLSFYSFVLSAFGVPRLRRHWVTPRKGTTHETSENLEAVTEHHSDSYPHENEKKTVHLFPNHSFPQ